MVCGGLSTPEPSESGKEWSGGSSLLGGAWVAQGQRSLPGPSPQSGPSMLEALAGGLGPFQGSSMRWLFLQDPRGLPQAHQPPHLHQPHPCLHHAEQRRPRR